MRPPALLRRILAAAALAAAPFAAAAGDGPLPTPLERTADAWSGHALADEEAARRGREALPFTQEQIETLGRLLRETQQAAARGAGAPPRGRVRRVRLDGGGDAIPAIRLRRGYVTAVSFSDMTGAPWPIEEALVDRRFLLLEGAGGAGEEARESTHLLYLSPAAAYLQGNAVVKLAGRPEPVVASLSGTGAEADFRVDIRLGVPGPNADPGALALGRGFHAGDPVLLGLLGGAVPPGAERLALEGGGTGDRAWRQGGDLLLVTRADLLSPGPLAAERGPGGRWAYRIADTPIVLVSEGGREARLSFTRPENPDVTEEADAD